MPNKEPGLRGKIVMRKGGGIYDADGNAILSFDEDMTIVDLTTTGNTILGDASGDTLTVNATSTFSAPVTVGVNGTGYDVTLFGDTAGCFLLWDEDADQLVITQTNAATTGTERTLDVSQTHTGIGASAEAFRSVITTNVAGGTYQNAIFGKIDYQTVGKVTGLAGVICAELTMAGGAVSQGTYATFESEINLPTSYSSDVPISVVSINTWGDQKADFDTYGYLFDITGVAVGSGKFFQENTAGDATHALRCRIGGTAYYLLATTTGA